MREFLYNLATDKTLGFFAGVLKFFLFVLSLVYGLFIRLLSWFRGLNSERLGCKVISIGNITLGGTGKTVLVEYIAGYLKGHGHKIAIVTRGYKRKIARNDTCRLNYEAIGDEPFMLRSRLEGVAVIVDANRIRGIKIATESYQADTVILDDGFQQWGIKKDLDVVVIDATNPFGNRQMLPRGILREPILALKRANAFILTKTNLNPNIEDVEEFLQTVDPHALIIESAHHPVGLYRLNEPDKNFALDMLKGKTVILFSGIGDPDSFQDLIEHLGANVGLSFNFPDHHDFSQQDLDNIFRRAGERNIDTIITTEKDAARLCQAQDTRHKTQVLVLKIELKITKNEEGLHSRLLKLYSL